MSDINKRKTAMVLYQIEESLGSFVAQKGDIDALNENVVKGIKNREIDRGRVLDSRSIDNVVEATYLKEVFQFALDVTRDTDLNDSIRRLVKLFDDLNIFDVRNAVSHPSRPFWDCYWYRVATIASDPVFDRLEIQDVKKALVSAEHNRIHDPPDEWLNQIIWQIPNNLPHNFDYAVTGLIGRKEEFQKLEEYITNLRMPTIALVAPGGIGKTALALCFLSKVVVNPKYSKIFDAVIYVSMKTEELVPNGITQLDAIRTIDELKDKISNEISSIFENEDLGFEETLKTTKDKKILLCIDNLETLLRDVPGAFEDINKDLPHSWKVLVTSRVNVLAAQIITLKPLKKKEALILATKYLASKGGDKLNPSDYERVIEECHYNPLAIRLTLDFMLRGRAMPDSISIATKEIAEYSYNNLIDTLSEASIEILQAIFIEGESTRSSLCELLDLEPDEVSDSIMDLKNTSLIHRISSEHGERYSLSDSIRELLITSPRDIQVREKVHNLVKMRGSRSKNIDIQQNIRETSEWDINYIPPDTPENLKIMILEVNKGRRKAERDPKFAASLYKDLMKISHGYSESNIFHRTLGQVLYALKDTNRAEDCYRRAIEINPNDFLSKSNLGFLLGRSNRYDEAIAVYQDLIDRGYTKDIPEQIQFGIYVYRGYFLNLLYSGQFDRILELTKSWEEAGSYSGYLGIYRASALKRICETTYYEDANQTIKNLIEASRIFTKVFDSYGYLKDACREASKLFIEINKCLLREEYKTEFEMEVVELLRFVSRNLADVRNQVTVNDNIINELSLLEIKNNPLESLASESGELEARSDGLVAVRVTKRPLDNPNFMFGEDACGKSYFLHRSYLKNASWEEWLKVHEGQVLNILPSTKTDKTKKNLSAEEIYVN